MPCGDCGDQHAINTWNVTVHIGTKFASDVSVLSGVSELVMGS
jgi:hypothetical protein